MKYIVKTTTRFKKSVKQMEKRGKSHTKLLEVVNKLAMGETLPPQYRDHALTGNFIGFRDCHIENDWVLIYKIQNDVLILTFADTGIHSDLGL